jgi:hypothetical protein
VNDGGQAIMRVDNTTKNLQFGDNRNSVRIMTKDRYTVGSVWIADMTHTPFGCVRFPTSRCAGPNPLQMLRVARILVVRARVAAGR